MKIKELLSLLRDGFSKIDLIDVESEQYKRLVYLLDNMSKEELSTLEQAKIKFVSHLARNRLRKYQ